MEPKPADLAIYVPWASVFYGSGAGNGSGEVVATGGDIQSAFLARALAERGVRVVHIVYALGEPPRELPENISLVEVATHPSARLTAKARRMAEAWRAFSKANARAYFFRGTGADLVIGMVFCAVRRRRLLFSAANDFDFDLSRRDRSIAARVLYRIAIRRAAAVVAQRDEQAELARRVMPRNASPIVIPSFSQEVPPGRAEAPSAFLWVGRLVDYKEPMAFVRLAREMPDCGFRMVAPQTNETPRWLAVRIGEEAQTLPNLEVLPLQPRERVLELMREALAVVATSRAEGMPNVFLEAWALGVPVLSLNFDPDGVIEREAAGVAAGGEWQRFAEGAKRIASDPSARAEMGARGNAYVRSRHAPDAVGDAWAGLVKRWRGQPTNGSHVGATPDMRDSS